MFGVQPTAMLSGRMSSDLGPGVVVAGFEIESVLGHGAMATVYRARDADGTHIALKLFDARGSTDERFRARFLRESELAQDLDHPHIVRILSSGESAGQLYLALQLIDGSDLRRILRRGRLDPDRAVEIVTQIAGALDAAHAAGVVHRDVKPGNILMDDQGTAYVCDFGLARHVASISSLTGDRGFVGTIDYVPPEQIEGSPVDARADVYSLGCVLYECLTGVRPFDRDSELAVVFAHLNESPPGPTEINPDLPAPFDDVIATALAKRPDDRYATCGELAGAAEAALRGQGYVRRAASTAPLHVRRRSACHRRRSHPGRGSPNGGWPATAPGHDYPDPDRWSEAGRSVRVAAAHVGSGRTTESRSSRPTTRCSPSGPGTSAPTSKV